LDTSHRAGTACLVWPPINAHRPHTVVVVTTNPLTRALVPDELDLLTICAEPHLHQALDWPVWDYVERRMLHKGRDARALLFGLGTVKRKNTMESYGFVYPTTWVAPHPVAKEPRDQLRLTVAGLVQLDAPEAHTRVEGVLTVISELADQEATLRPDPTRPVGSSVTWSEVESILRSRFR
jgi:hypothetical protein